MKKSTYVRPEEPMSADIRQRTALWQASRSGDVARAPHLATASVGKLLDPRNGDDMTASGLTMLTEAQRHLDVAVHAALQPLREGVWLIYANPEDGAIRNWFYTWRKLTARIYMRPEFKWEPNGDAMTADAGYCLDRYDGSHVRELTQ